MPAPGPDPCSDLRKRIAVLEKHNAEFSLRISALMNELPEDKRGGYMWDKRDELETLKKRIAELERERDEARKAAKELNETCHQWTKAHWHRQGLRIPKKDLVLPKLPWEQD